MTGLRTLSLLKPLFCWVCPRKLKLCAGLSSLCVVGVVGVLAIALIFGPVAIPGLSQRLASAIEHYDSRLAVVVRQASLTFSRQGLTLRLDDVKASNEAANASLQVPRALFGLDAWQALKGTFAVTSAEFHNLDIKLTMQPDGSLSFGTEAEAEQSAQISVPERQTSQLAAFAASLNTLVSQSQTVLGQLDHVKVKDAVVRIFDARHREAAEFREVEVVFLRPQPDSQAFEAHIKGAGAPWTLRVTMAPGEDGKRIAQVEWEEAPASDLLVFARVTQSEVSSTMRLSGQARFVMGPDGQLSDAALTTTGSPASVTASGLSGVPLNLGGLTLNAGWNEATQTLTLQSLGLQSAAGLITLSGTAMPHEGGWAMRLQGKDMTLPGAGAHDPPVAIERFEALLTALPTGGWTIDRVEAMGPSLGLAVSGHWTEDSLKLGLSAAQSDARALLGLWPSMLAPDVRTYFIRHLHEGRADSLSIALALTPEQWRHVYAGGNLPDESLHFKASILQGRLSPAEGLPPLSDGSFTVSVTGQTARVDVGQASVTLPDNRAMTMSAGTLIIPDTHADTPGAKSSFRLTGPADALVSLVQTPAIRGSMETDIDVNSVSGKADLRVSLGFPLSATLDPSQVQASASGTVSDLTIDPVAGKERIDNTTLNLTYDAGGFTAKGEGRLSGIPASIDLRQPLQGFGELNVALTLDEAARGRRGMSFGSRLSGPVPVRLTLPLSKAAAKTRRVVEADLAKASIDGLIPGWTKPTGRPAKLSFVLSEASKEGSSTLNDIVLEGVGISVRGSAVVNANHMIESASFPVFRLSSSDDIKLEASRKESVLTWTARGSSIDAKPFLKSLMAPSSGKAEKGDEPQDMDVDLGVATLAGFNGESMGGVSLKLARRRGEVRQFQLNGRLGGAPIYGQIISRAQGGAPVIVVQSGNGGALLRFGDFYRRMVGGDLALQLALGSTGAQSGNVLIRNFSLRNEPALKTIIGGQEGKAQLNPSLSLEGGDVPFTRLQAQFVRNLGRLDIREATMWGTQVGFNLEGSIDYARDATDLSGTFVPAYAVNNVFSQIPVVGPILGGGQREGLFAVNFRINGPASAPMLTVNPLSAVAPGIFRKFFDWGPTATGAIPGEMPARPER